jgi:hypothetical protein
VTRGDALFAACFLAMHESDAHLYAWPRTEEDLEEGNRLAEVAHALGDAGEAAGGNWRRAVAWVQSEDPDPGAGPMPTEDEGACR